MKRILLTALLFLSLMVCLTSPLWAGGVEDLNAGLKAYDRGDFDEAIRFCTSAIKSGTLSQKDLSAAYAFRGAAWFKQGVRDNHDYDKAIADLTKAIELDQQLDIAYYIRGLAWDRKGDYDKAIADYTKVIEIVPKDAELYYLRGLAWRRKSNYDRAIADFTKAIELAPRYADAYSERGFTWRKKGDYNRAIADYTKVIEIDPKDSLAYHERGRAWEAKGNYDKAKADYTKANELIDEANDE